mgnify:CR=1 FL=1
MVVATLTQEFRKVRTLADAAIAQLDDAQLNLQIDPEANSVAMLMQHMAGNMRSRWTDFLTSDGEKPWRNRDAEFETPGLDRAELLASWESGWTTLFDALGALTDADLERTVTIRSEGQSVMTALARQLSHYAGHAYQIVLLAKHLKGDAWAVLTIPRGQSSAFNSRMGHATPPGA